MRYIFIGILLFICTVGYSQIGMTLRRYRVTAAPSQWPSGYVHCNSPETVINDVTSTTGAVWMDRNLGADQLATSSTDALAYGDLFQWGRFAEGHQCRSSATTSTNATTASPSLGNSWDGLFILEPSSPYDWLVPQNNNLWQGVNGVNNPCPSGYRVPTESELNAERLSWSTNNSAGAFGSPLKFTVAGYRDPSSGVFFSVGSGGNIWSSTVSGSEAIFLRFFNSGSDELARGRSRGVSIRCIKD